MAKGNLTAVEDDQNEEGADSARTLRGRTSARLDRQIAGGSERRLVVVTPFFFANTTFATTPLARDVHVSADLQFAVRVSTSSTSTVRRRRFLLGGE